MNKNCIGMNDNGWHSQWHCFQFRRTTSKELQLTSCNKSWEILWYPSRFLGWACIFLNRALHLDTGRQYRLKERQSGKPLFKNRFLPAMRGKKCTRLNATFLTGGRAKIGAEFGVFIDFATRDPNEGHLMSEGRRLKDEMDGWESASGQASRCRI